MASRRLDNALNSYWSPLYIWLMAAAFAIFRPSIRWQLPVIHAVNLLGFFAALAAWEWLTAEWEKWQGPPSRPILIDIAGYYVITWSGLLVATISLFNTPDIFVEAALIAAAAILVRVRRGAATQGDFVILGIALGAGFLAKTAFVTLFPIFIVVLALLLRPQLREFGFLPSGYLQTFFDRRILITAFMAFLVAAPFVTALSIAHHRFTIGDSGRVNYSWQVTGMSVEGYKENAYWPGSEAKHPIRVLMDHPRVLSYEQHLTGTLPVHTDPAWWCEGFPVRFDKARQLMILWSNIKFSLSSFRCKILPLVLLGLPFGAREIGRRFSQTWFILVPALFFIATYLPVFAESRYLAGSYALFGFALVAAIWRTPLPAQRPVWIAVIAVFLALSFRHWIPSLAADITGKKHPPGYGNMQVAENMQRYGLRPGDRVAYIGLSLVTGIHHVGLSGAQIVATVPERITHADKTPGRPLVFTFPKPDEFWRSSPEVRQRVFEAFRSVGAKWVFADVVPKWADITGWQVAGEEPWAPRQGDRNLVYFRKLE